MNTVNSFNSNNSYETIGDILRNKRESLGISLEEAAYKLRIRFIFLQALEDNEIDKLPGIAYASGFIRTYADYLGLNSAELVQRFRAENQGDNAKPKLMFPAPVPQSGVPAGVYIFFGVVIIVIAYVGWYKMTDHQEVVSNTVPTISNEVNSQSHSHSHSDKVVLSPQVASVIPSEHPALPPQSEQHNVQADAQALQKQIQEANQASNPVPPALQPDAGKESSAVSQPTVNDDKDKHVVADHKIYINAEKGSWLLVKSHDGKVLFQRVLKAGEKWMIPEDQTDVVLTVGNAGVVTLERNGKQSLALGKVGRVRRHLIIDAQTLDKLFPEDLNSASTKPSATNTQDSSNNSETQNDKPIKPVANKVNEVKKPKPSRVAVHPDVSADDLNAKQLNH